MLLAIATFSLSLLGTFLVRSGVLTSVHAFANDPERGLFILMLLGSVVGGALLLLVLRGNTIRSDGRFGLFSRESMLLVNNLLLVGAAIVVLTGTLYPLIVDVFNGAKLSVGPPYFNALFVPLSLALMLALGLGPLLRWKNDEPAMRIRAALPVLTTCAVLGIAATWFFGDEFRALVALSLTLVLWVVAGGVRDVMKRIRHRSRKAAALLTLPRAFAGMLIAHLGVAVCATGVAVTSVYSVERDVQLAPDEVQIVGPYAFELTGVRVVDGPNYEGTLGTIRVTDPGSEEQVTVLQPEKRLYPVRGSVMTEAAIHPSLTTDLFVALGQPLAEGAWAVRVHYKPFVRWIWLGALLMAVGGGIAASDPRYRFVRQRKSARLAASPGEVVHVAHS